MTQVQMRLLQKKKKQENNRKMVKHFKQSDFLLTRIILPITKSILVAVFHMQQNYQAKEFSINKFSLLTFSDMQYSLNIFFLLKEKRE